MLLYREVEPHPALKRHVVCFWFLEACGRARSSGPQVVPADGCPELLVHFGVCRLRLGPSPCHEPRSLLFGQLTQPVRLATSGRVGVVGARLHPHGSGLVTGGSPPSPDGSISLGELWGRRAAELEERVMDAADPGRRIRIVEEMLLDRLETAPALDHLVEGALALLHQAKGRLRIDHLAREVGISRRQLQRRFLDTVGLTPKLFSRIVRFRAALAALDDRPLRSCAEIALDCGYYDQAHFVREFSQFAGLPPARFALAGNPWT